MAKPVNIGDFKHRITLQKAGRVRKPGGGYDNSPVWIADVWAKHETKTGFQTTEAGQQSKRVTNVFTIRYRADYAQITSIVFNGRSFAIESPIINPDESTNTFLVIEAVEGGVT